jgi:hypothetical protein
MGLGGINEHLVGLQQKNASMLTGWFCCLFSLALGLLWFSMSEGYGVHYRLFHPDTLGYVLMLVGFVTVPVMAYASAACLRGYQEATTRICRIVSFAVPMTLVVGWLICRTGDALIYLGIIS